MSNSTSDDLDFTGLSQAETFAKAAIPNEPPPARSEPDKGSQSAHESGVHTTDAPADGRDAKTPPLPGTPESANSGIHVPKRSAGAGALPESDHAHLHRGASRLAALGSLVNAEQDVLLLHTRHAVSLFIGPSSEARGSGSGIPDGQRFAIALRHIWSLTARDNPYADWLLIQFDQSLHEVRGRIAQATQGPLDALEALKHQGLQYSLLEAEAPTKFELVPDSPYTYATASVIAAFDQYARMIRTLVRKDRISDIEGHQAIQPLVRTLRTLFASPLPCVRKLQSQHVRRLRRNDFLPEANQTAQARVNLARELFGPLPRAVFTGAKQPRHTLRDPLLSAALRHSLEEASRDWTELSPSDPEVVQ